MDAVNSIEEFNYFLATPSLIAFTTILALISLRRWRQILWNNYPIAGLLISLLLMNLIEVITFTNLNRNFDLLIRLYYLTTILSVAFFVALSEQLNEFYLKKKQYLLLLYWLPPIFLILIVCSSDLIIAGAERTSYSISRIPGDFYWIFLVYSLSFLVGGAYMIVRSIRLADNLLDKKRNLVILYAVMPMVVVAVIIIFVTQIGLEINLSIFFPLCTLAFVITYLFTETKHDLIRFLVKIPYSRERAAYLSLDDKIIDYLSKTEIDEKAPLKAALAELEQLFIQIALDIKGGDHAETADMLSISMSSVYRNKGKSPGQTKSNS